MNLARSASPPDGARYGERQRHVQVFHEFCPCSFRPRKMRLSWSLISCFEIAVLSLAMIVYFFISRTTLQNIIPENQNSTKTVVINELSEWMLRLYASSIVTQITLLICGMTFGDVNSRKIIYWGLLVGNILSVAIYSAFVHSMSTWNAANIAYVTLPSMFGFLKIVVLVLNPVWWVWKTSPFV
ncbi:predicted protein [Nematostella vectensis]|uniref:Uncharacterized protein n=1 Tax=Nematostella vectensis TaxID=45351 RepID=A7RLZ2_NEMVE|nr:predicted protein [Nematostella vectensis]|eukprot:XP_001639572.1 predicted protein [Nematostella vectensis]